MARPCISVALATFNGEKYIYEQLASIAHQSRLPDELIISDDASSDSTLEIINAFSLSVPFPLRIIAGKENIGYSRNFSRALEHCSGQIVFLCDQDDYWFPQKIETIINYFENNPQVELVIHDLEFCGPDLAPTGQTKIERMRGVVNVEQNYVVGMATAIRAKFLKHCLPIPDVPGLSHDMWLHYCAFAVGRKHVMSEALALYRRHLTNATTSIPINSGSVTSRWALRMAMLTYRTKISGVDQKTLSPLANWLMVKQSALVAEGYVTEREIDMLIAREAERRQALLERKRILGLPRWRRLASIGYLLASRKSRRFYTWKSAFKDVFFN